MEKLTKQQHKFVCEILWGGPPEDREWAESTPLYQKEAPVILKRYPMLDKSFFEEHNKRI